MNEGKSHVGIMEDLRMVVVSEVCSLPCLSPRVWISYCHVTNFQEAGNLVFIDVKSFHC